MKTGLHLKNKAGGGCMFQIGDEISYTNKGIFQVKEIINKRNRKREVESWCLPRTRAPVPSCRWHRGV